MHKILFSVLTALAVVLLPQLVAAQEGKRPDGPRPEMRRQQPNPEVMFKRLDANHDGVITPDEIPAGAPERLKQLLKRADRNGDKKLALAELTEAMKRLPPMGATRGGPPGQPPQRAVTRPVGRPMMPPPGLRPGSGPSPRPHAWGGPNAGSMSKQPQAKGMHGGKGPQAKGMHHGKHHHGKCMHDGKHHQAKGMHGGKGPQAKGRHEAVKGPWQKSGVRPSAKKGVCPLAKKPEATAPAARKHEARKPEAKRPEAKKREVKVEVKVTADKKAIEAKLASLEREKAATINSLQKAQQAASAKMNELNKQRAEILQSLQKE